MNARDCLRALNEKGPIGIPPYLLATIRAALELKAAAEGGEGTPETDAEVSGIRPWDRDGVLVVGWDDYCALRNRCGLHERERNGLAARVGKLEALLTDLLSTKRYDANNGRGGEGKFVTMNIRAELVKRADAAIDAARRTK